MSGRVGSITTDIIADGLILNMDAANRASTIPSTSTDKTFNTVDTSISGSFVNDTIFDASTITPSYAFDGVADYINCGPLTSFLSNVSQFSISLWVKVDDTGESRWAGKHQNTSNWISCQLNSNNFIYFSNHNGSVGAGYCGFEAVSSGKITPGNWYNYVGVFDGTLSVNADRLKIYWNSEKQTVTTTGTITSTTSNFTSNPDFRIGGDGYSDNADGNIGCAQIYNRALSSTEVLHNYNALKGRFGF